MYHDCIGLVVNCVSIVLFYVTTRTVHPELAFCGISSGERRSHGARELRPRTRPCHTCFHGGLTWCMWQYTRVTCYSRPSRSRRLVQLVEKAVDLCDTRLQGIFLCHIWLAQQITQRRKPAPKTFSICVLPYGLLCG